jgi:hypothetical protein
MSISFLVFLVIGKLFIYLGMHFPPLAESRFSFVKRLWTCDLCAGVWVYSFLSLVMGEILFREIFYFPLVSELATGGLVGFLMHILILGWKSKFEVIIIE